MGGVASLQQFGTVRLPGMFRPSPPVASGDPADRTRNIRRWTLLGIAAITALFGAVVLPSTFGRTAADRAQAWVAHTERVLALVNEVELAVTDAETGQRGYLLTSRAAYLAPYTSARTRVAGALRALRDSTADNAAQQRRLVTVAATIAAKQKELARTIALVDAGRHDAAIALVGTDRGAQFMSDLRRELDDVRGEERRLLSVRTAASASAESTFRVQVLIGAALALTAALLTLGVVIRGAGRLASSAAARDALHRALGASEAELRAMVDHAATGIMVVAPNGAFVRANGAFHRFLGYPDGTLVGRYVADVAPDAATRLRELMKTLRAGDAPSVSAEVRFLRADGAERWAEWTGTLVPLADTNVGVLAMTVDVTERRRAALALGESEARLRGAMDASSDACFLLETAYDADGQIRDFVITDANAGAGALYGMPAEDLIGHELAALFPILRVTGAFDTFRTVAETGVSYEAEYKTRDPRTNAAWLSLQVVPLRNDPGAGGAIAGLAITARDISARRRTEGEQRLLSDVTTALASAPDAAGALGAAIQLMCAATGMPYGETWVPGGDATAAGQEPATLVRGPVWHASDDARARDFADASRAFTFVSGVGLPGRAAAAGAPIWIPDVTAADAAYPRAALARRARLRGGLAVPVTVEGALIAVLAFHARDASEVGQTELDLLATVGAQVGAVVRQKMADAALREREAELRLTQEAGGLRGWTLDFSTDRLQFAAGSPRVVALPDQLSGAVVWALMHADDLPRADDDLASALAHPTGAYASTYRVPGPDGTLRWVRATGEVERNPDGTPRRLRGVSVDVTSEVEMRRRAEASEAELRALFFAMRDVVLVYDGDGTYVQIMQTAPERPFGSLDGLIGRRVHDVMPSDVADGILRTVRAVLDTGTVQHLDYELDLSGGAQSLAGTGSPLGPNRVLWVARDVTAQQAAKAALRQSEARFRGVLENLSAYAMELDRSGRVMFVNDALLGASGWARHEVLARDFFSHFAPNDDEVGRTFAARVAADAVPAHHERELVTRDGTRRIVAWDNAVLRDAEGRVSGIASVGRDVTAERQLADERDRLVGAMAALAEQDELTGMCNRRAFVRMAAQERKSAVRTGRLDAVCVVDLDQFKAINDTHGHAEGDAALCAVARLLRATVRDADFAARIGGDEFVVYAVGISEVGGAHALAERLRAALAVHNAAATAAARPYTLSFSVGVAEFAPAEDLDEAIARADAALYAAKAQRRLPT